MDVSSIIGDYGKFQRNVYLFTLLREAPNGLHLVVYSFFFPAVAHWCAMPETIALNITSEQRKVHVLPYSSFNADSSAYRGNQCNAFTFYITEAGALVQGNTSTPCDKWEYGKSYYRGSLVKEWDLVCNRAWMRSLVQTATMIGMLVGTLASSLGDRFGRRPMVITGYVTSLIGSACVAVSPWFSALLASRGLLGFGLGMGQSSSFCLHALMQMYRTAKTLYIVFTILAFCPAAAVMEVIGLQERTAAALALGVGFSLGIILLPGLAWFLQDWRTRQWAISAPFVVFIVWSWFLPESPRWLIAKGKLPEARKVILKACAVNGLQVEEIDVVLAQLRKKVLQEEEAARKKASCVDLLRSRRMLLYTLILVYASTAGGITFYGLQLSVTSLGGDPYLTFVLAALVELPAVLVCYAAIRWCRRRPTMLAVYGGVALSTLAVCLLPLAWLVLSGFPSGVLVFCALNQRTYLSDSVPMGTLVAIAALASMLMLLLPETFRVTLPDTIRESKDLGNSRILKKDRCSERFAGESTPDLLANSNQQHST